MSSRLISRRKLLGSLGIVALAAPILQACGGAPAAPTAAPQAAATSAPKPAATTAPAAATSAPAAKPTAAPTPQSQAAPSGGKINISVAVYPDPNRTWMRTWSQKWADARGNVNLKIDDINYNDMSQKILAELATGTVQDVTFAGVKYMRVAAYKGAYLPIDDYVKAKDPGMSDFIPTTMENAKFEGKLYGLPYEFNTGNRNTVFVNMDLVKEKGAKPPTDDWTYEDYLTLAKQLADKSKGIFGTDLLEETYYDFGTLARAWGGDIMTPDYKKWTIGTDPKSIEAARWQTELRTKHQIAPSRAESQGLQFPSGKLGLYNSGMFGVMTVQKTVADKFKWDAFLPPRGPGGIRGFDSFAAFWLIYSKSKQPEAAFELQSMLSSKEASVDALVKEGQAPARISTWMSDEAQKIHTIFGRVGKWISDPKEKGPFQIPDNLRFQELEDMYENLCYAMFYGEVPFEEGLKKVQDEGDKIMAKPRP